MSILEKDKIIKLLIAVHIHVIDTPLCLFEKSPFKSTTFFKSAPGTKRYRIVRSLKQSTLSTGAQ